MKRHEAREKLIISVYQYLLLGGSLDELVQKNFDEEIIDPYTETIKEMILEKKNEYIDRITPHLKNWTFDRLGYLDQAILLVAIAELDLKENDKAVIIDEAVSIAKTYCDEKSYSYINGVLDKI